MLSDILHTIHLIQALIESKQLAKDVSAQIEASRMIQEAKEKGWTSLELWRYAGRRLLWVPQKIAELSNLKRLIVSGHDYLILTKQLWMLSNLENLNLSNNQLEAIPAELGNLKKLVALNLSGNELTTLPEETGKLENMETLDLSRNKLTRLPRVIGRLKNLKELYISGNSLRCSLSSNDLPKELVQLSNLKILDLGFNRLELFPTEVQGLTNLTHLNLRGNPLKSLEGIKKLRKLAHLNLGYPPLINLYDLRNVAKGLTNLKFLYLDRNALEIFSNAASISYHFNDIPVAVLDSDDYPIDK